MRARCISAAVAATLLVVGPAHAQPPEPTVEDIAARVDRLADMPDAEASAGDAIRHARLALRQARELESAGRGRQASRARQIAWAALSLATRQIALGRATAALREAEHRAVAAAERARAARQALDAAVAQRERARAARGGRPGPAPATDTAPDTD